MKSAGGYPTPGNRCTCERRVRDVVKRLSYPSLDRISNAAGAVAWADGYGSLAFLVGERLERVPRLVGIVGVVGALVSTVFVLRFLRRHEAQLEAAAERALPGPLR
jgi:hypothetical protein